MLIHRIKNLELEMLDESFTILMSPPFYERVTKSVIYKIKKIDYFYIKVIRKHKKNKVEEGVNLKH